MKKRNDDLEYLVANARNMAEPGTGDMVLMGLTALVGVGFLLYAIYSGFASLF